MKIAVKKYVLYAQMLEKNRRFHVTQTMLGINGDAERAKIEMLQKCTRAKPPDRLEFGGWSTCVT